jgi:hypothetical protein
MDNKTINETKLTAKRVMPAGDVVRSLLAATNATNQT